ncbi:hypothetical protein VF_A0634 [Aliivibrio fischeri ES114]|uniref:Uncharacterized protein n=1 Tax=Aliivibrio fischeri (strain ATCC 700601 / ES114) TaxID=312309 RepID=Q5DZU2_ALIF1|nr:hypothetical protein [Aliivibrio fischeri]AAW87704.1 hypothetical protein VF_A0634 [Aliivibrio fischeri ES114]KLU78145.1 hypothetical protein AB192_13290 [Aliivibrio fischeri]
MNYEKWRIENIKPILKEFKVASRGMDISTQEWKSLNKNNQYRIKKLINSSPEYQKRTACEEAYINTKGYTQNRI